MREFAPRSEKARDIIFARDGRWYPYSPGRFPGFIGRYVSTIGQTDTPTPIHILYEITESKEVFWRMIRDPHDQLDDGKLATLPPTPDSLVKIGTNATVLAPLVVVPGQKQASMTLVFTRHNHLSTTPTRRLPR